MVELIVVKVLGSVCPKRVFIPIEMAERWGRRDTFPWHFLGVASQIRMPFSHLGLSQLSLLLVQYLRVHHISFMASDVYVYVVRISA